MSRSKPKLPVGSGVQLITDKFLADLRDSVPALLATAPAVSVGEEKHSGAAAMSVAASSTPKLLRMAQDFVDAFLASPTMGSVVELYTSSVTPAKQYYDVKAEAIELGQSVDGNLQLSLMPYDAATLYVAQGALNILKSKTDASISMFALAAILTSATNTKKSSTPFLLAVNDVLKLRGLSDMLPWKIRAAIQVAHGAGKAPSCDQINRTVVALACVQMSYIDLYQWSEVRLDRQAAKATYQTQMSAFMKGILQFATFKYKGELAEGDTADGLLGRLKSLHLVAADATNLSAIELADVLTSYREQVRVLLRRFDGTGLTIDPKLTRGIIEHAGRKTRDTRWLSVLLNETNSAACDERTDAVIDFIADAVAREEMLAGELRKIAPEAEFNLNTVRQHYSEYYDETSGDRERLRGGNGERLGNVRGALVAFLEKEVKRARQPQDVDAARNLLTLVDALGADSLDKEALFRLVNGFHQLRCRSMLDVVGQIRSKGNDFKVTLDRMDIFALFAAIQPHVHAVADSLTFRHDRQLNSMVQPPAVAAGYNSFAAASAVAAGELPGGVAASVVSSCPGMGTFRIVAVEDVVEDDAVEEDVFAEVLTGGGK